MQGGLKEVEFEEGDTFWRDNLAKEKKNKIKKEAKKVCKRFLEIAKNTQKMKRIEAVNKQIEDRETKNNNYAEKVDFKSLSLF